MIDRPASIGRRILRAVVSLGGLAALAAAAGVAERFPDATLSIDAAKYLQLVDALDGLNPESVDYRIGRAGSVDPAPLTYGDIVFRGTTLAAHLESAHTRPGPASRRAAVLIRETQALVSRGAMLSGRPTPFHDQLRSLFNVDPDDVRQRVSGAPSPSTAALERRLRGGGPLASRLAAYQRRFTVPRGRLDAVIARAIAICRARTRAFIKLPDEEGVEIEYVAERPWSAYTLYRGNYRSVIQVNRAMPITIAQALSLGCHEGYPGHHVINVLRDRERVHTRAFDEAKALLVFSPEGFRAEALATAAAVDAFSAGERAHIYADELFPLAGLDPQTARTYTEMLALVEPLDAVMARAVAGYVSGVLTRAEAEQVFTAEALIEQPAPLLDYLDRYGAYALAYTWGRDRVLAELRTGGSDARERWTRLKTRLTSPADVVLTPEPSLRAAHTSPALHRQSR